MRPHYPYLDDRSPIRSDSHRPVRHRLYFHDHGLDPRYFTAVDLDLHTDAAKKTLLPSACIVAARLKSSQESRSYHDSRSNPGPSLIAPSLQGSNEPRDTIASSIQQQGHTHRRQALCDLQHTVPCPMASVGRVCRVRSIWSCNESRGPQPHFAFGPQVSNEMQAFCRMN